jgi:hypothetical protein
VSKFGKPYAFFRKISRNFLFSEIRYRKTKWDSGAFFPVADPQLAMEVSDEARTCANRLVGRPSPVLVGRVRVGHGHQRRVSMTLGGLSDGWSKSQKSIFGKPYAFFKNFSVYFFLFSEIQYRKTKWDSGALFPVADPQLGTEVSDRGRTCAFVDIGRPPPVLVGRVRVGLGHPGANVICHASCAQKSTINSRLFRKKK